jgi:hypothetical protein
MTSMAVAMLQMAEMFTKKIYDQVSEKSGKREDRETNLGHGLLLPRNQPNPKASDPRRVQAG